MRHHFEGKKQTRAEYESSNVSACGQVYVFGLSENKEKDRYVYSKNA